MTFGLRLGRWAWVAAALAAAVLSVRQTHHIWGEAGTIGAAAEWYGGPGQYHLTASQVRALEDIGLSEDWHAAFVTIRFSLFALITLAIATLLWRGARTWAPLFLSWFLLTGLVLAGIGDIEGAGAIPGWLELPTVILVAGGFISMVSLLLVFPDDRSAHWVVTLLLAATLVPLIAWLADSDGVGDWLWNYGIFVALTLLLFGLGLQIARIVRSRDRTARDLLIVMVVGMTAMYTLGFGSDTWSGIRGSRRGLGSLVQRLAYETAFMAVPLLLGLAVLWILVRRGHWDMDVQLKGSVGYAGLTTVLVLGYFGAVALIQAIVNDVSGTDGSTFALMVSTGVIAAAFLPARARLQGLVDRIFDRRRRDAEQLVDGFGATIGRDRHPDEVAGALLKAVDDVFRPEQVDLWLAPERQP